LKPASLKDIAAKLGLSVATVSRALQDNPAISQQTRELVMQVAKEMHYSKNFIANSLRSGQLPVIGVIVPHGVTLFYSSVIDGIEQEASAAGYAVISMNSHESFEREQHNVENLKRLHVAGIIASVTQETDSFTHFSSLADDHIPVVFVARDIPDSPEFGVQQFSSVTADSVEAAHRATRHLIEQGCRRIAILCGPSRLKMVQERKHGYIEALHDNRLLVRPEYVAYSDIDISSAIDATNSLLDLPERPDAIIALNDTLLFAAMKAIKQNGLSIPHDVALIGFSDVEYVEDVTPTLSTIEDQSHLMGQTACRLLLDHIHGQQLAIHRIIPTIQKIRESSQRHPTS
jgi:LacI family transcriptional regulator